MFETAELGRCLDKETFNALQPKLRLRLLEVQRRLRDARLPVHVIVAGVDGAGKGETVNLLASWMDPRFISTMAFGPRTDEEAQRPFFWRYWRSLAPKGRLGVYFGSWYTEPITERVDGTLKGREFERRLRQIEAFERNLVDDGALLIKLWFHLSKKAQKKRLQELHDDKRTRWRVSKQDLENLERYDDYAEVSEAALRQTSTGQAPWTLIEGEDARYRTVAVVEHLLEVIEKRLARDAAASASASEAASAPETKTKTKTKTKATSKATAKSAKVEPTTAVTTATATVPTKRLAAELARQEARSKTPKTRTKHDIGDEQPPAVRTILESLDLGRVADDDSYDDDLETLQGRLSRVWHEAQGQGTSLTVVLEGWDAAGKGGAIRRITPALDARDYRIIPIAAPTDEEKAQHHLWRFWRHVPTDGHVTIYDRSWYGRVLVERIEGFCDEEAWMRAYDEINEFEEQLVEGDIVVVKLWLHISKDEQLKRFQERETIAFKNFKISDEDYRNRDRWDDYVQAVHDMVERTSTSYAPWHLVPANDKHLARLQVLEHICVALEKSLGLEPEEGPSAKALAAVPEAPTSTSTSKSKSKSKSKAKAKSTSKSKSKSKATSKAKAKAKSKQHD